MAKHRNPGPRRGFEKVGGYYDANGRPVTGGVATVRPREIRHAANKRVANIKPRPEMRDGTGTVADPLGGGK